MFCTRPLLTCVWDESLQVGSGSLVLQQLLRWNVCEEHLQDGLSILTVPGVGVPDHAVAQEWLCVGSKELSVWWRWRGKEEKRLYYFHWLQAFFLLHGLMKFLSSGMTDVVFESFPYWEVSRLCLFIPQSLFTMKPEPQIHRLHIDKLVYFIFQLWIFNHSLFLENIFFFLFLCSIMIKLSDWPVTFLIQSKLQQRLLQQLAAILHLSDRYRQREKTTCQRRQTVGDWGTFGGVTEFLSLTYIFEMIEGRHALTRVVGIGSMWHVEVLDLLMRMRMRWECLSITQITEEEILNNTEVCVAVFCSL